MDSQDLRWELQKAKEVFLYIKRRMQLLINCSENLPEISYSEHGSYGENS
jgi:hypothetical protein